MRGLASALWVGLIVWASLGVAQTEPNLEARVRGLLADGVEQSVTPQALAKLGPALPAALQAIFERTSEARYVRLRALSMLSHQPQPRVTQLFVRLLREGVEPAPTATLDALHPSRSVLVLRRAIEGIAMRKVVGMDGPLLRALTHRDAHVRRAAVLALDDSLGDEVQRALSQQLTRESSPIVIRALTDRSARSQGRPPSGPGNATQPR